MHKPIIVDQPLPGLFLIESFRQVDHRGTFTKIFQDELFEQQNISFTPAEIFFSHSRKGVLRGMHYQSASSYYNKLVTCLRGNVLDVVVDIRPDSPNFNKPYSIELAETDGLILLVGKGYAHGFLSLTSDSLVLYSTSIVHQPAMDMGVLWSSINFSWPIEKPILSDRDSSHIMIHSLTSDQSTHENFL